MNDYKKEKHCSSTFTIRVFLPHGENCEVCFSCNKSSKSKGSFWKKNDKLTLSINYIRLKDSKIVVLKKGSTTSQSTPSVVWYVT